MRARWIREDSPKSHIGLSVIATWFPGRYYLVSTICCDGTSPLARLTRSLETSESFEQIRSAPKRFVTNVFGCNRQGFARKIDNPLHESVYFTEEESKTGHITTVQLLAEGKLKLAPPQY